MTLRIVGRATTGASRNYKMTEHFKSGTASTNEALAVEGGNDGTPVIGFCSHDPNTRTHVFQQQFKPRCRFGTDQLDMCWACYHSRSVQLNILSTHRSAMTVVACPWAVWGLMLISRSVLDRRLAPPLPHLKKQCLKHKISWAAAAR